MKIRPVGAEFFLADRRTDMTKLMVAFLYFANAPKIEYFYRIRLDMLEHARTHTYKGTLPIYTYVCVCVCVYRLSK
jgi:ADP-glucose pyrophosphorylase